MKVVAIIQARMGSTRLPGKVLKEINGKTLLGYQIERVKQSKSIDQIVIATTDLMSDQPIVDFCLSSKIDFYRGSEKDVLSRYYEAAQQYKADIIVRLTSDCPIIDPIIIDDVINHFIKKNPKVDYTSNTLERTYPRGLDTEVISFEGLKKAHEEATLERDREHVTAYLYTNPNKFKLSGIVSVNDYSHHRWTVDTEEDFKLISLILNEIYDENYLFVLEDVITLMDENPEWIKINQQVEQKKI